MGIADQMITEGPVGGGRGSSMQSWFDNHPKQGKDGPMGVCETFVTLRAEGKTNWSISRFHAAMVKQFNFPFASEPALANFLKKTWPDLYGRRTVR